ncbi:MAG TPA: aminoglycoside phosphotransferase family protein [Rhizomicrobium sp.]|jgi:5-methylthioribose kinase
MTSPNDDVAAALAAMGLAAPVALHPMAGGVSCDVWRVDLPDGPICVKRALPKLRVTADWRAPPERSEVEVAWLRLAAEIDPALVPKVLGEDRARHIFAMQFLPPDRYPLWKAQLAAGVVDVEFAAQVGAALARIHAATARRADIAAQFDNGAQFRALRLDPYLLYTASKHPDLTAKIVAIADGVANARIALMQGDISPKNILCSPHGPVFLDAETACYGDPAFDLAFCLNHLLLKCVWRPQHRNVYCDSFTRLKDAYLKNVDWEPSADIERRTLELLPALLLARIDGKSPVEYITDEHDKTTVRHFAREHLIMRKETLQHLADDWRFYLVGANSR